MAASHQIEKESQLAGVHAGVTGLALSLAAGLTIGRLQGTPWVWPWIGAAGAVLVLSMLLRRKARLRVALFNATVIALGAAWFALTQHHVTADDLTASAGETPTLLRVRGVALSPPVLRMPTQGAMAVYDYRDPAMYFPMRIDALLDRQGNATPVRGRVLVRVDETVQPFRAGDGIETIGYLSRPPPPSNPGEFDVQRYALARGQAGVLNVANRDLVRVRPAERSGLVSSVVNWRDRVRRRAGAWLLSDLPRSDRTERDALLAALLLGQRDQGLAGLDDSFRRVGLAHLLAISGLHLGVLVGIVLMLVTWGGHARRGHGLVMIAVVLAYLFLVEVRLPVLRAGVMTIAAGVALTASRRWRIGSLIGLSAIVLLVWRPDQLFTAGFQLSYGVVLALIHFAPPVRRRWFGRPDPEAATSAQMAGQWLKSALVVAIIAWAVATPITVYHFGMISPAGVPLSVIALPIVALLLAVGYGKMMLAVFLPSAALLAGAVLAVLADLLVSLVTAMDSLPGTVVHVPRPPAIWSIAALIWVGAWALGAVARRKAVWSAAAIALLAWLSWPLLSAPVLAPALRIDMLSVGDGSCFILRSGGETLLFDAGSTTNLDAGRRILAPAMRRLGVRSIDAVAISHPDLDHHSAVLDLADAFDVGHAMITPQFAAAARADPHGPSAFLLDGLTRRRVAVRELTEGDRFELGRAVVRCLHPPRHARLQHDNDSSLVLAVEAGGRTVLMTGDVQREAIDEISRRYPALSADVIEMPHHGRRVEEAIDLVARLRPTVLLRSTGRARWQREQWDETPGIWLVTARDGACHVSIDGAGAISVGRFRETED